MTIAVDAVCIRHAAATRWTPDGVTFDARAGEVLLLLGPSGSGKSTLALALNGLIPHALPAQLEGAISVDGALTTERTVAQLSERVAMVFQDPDAQLVTGTLLDEVCFGPENLRVPKHEVLARAENALRAVGLWERRGEDPGLLSGGGRQRLAIACALALESPTIVLDEPTANLDPAGIEDVYAALRDVVSGGTRCIVLIEHNLDAAIALVDRVVVLDRDGRVAMDGTVDDVVRNGHATLAELGIWIPVSAIAALRLRAAGVPLDPLPLTSAELAAALDAVETLPPPTRGDSLETIELGCPSTGGCDEPPPRGDSSSGGAVVAVDDLTIARRGTVILRDVSLRVQRGEMLAIVGVNGAGKTTLLQAIAGVIRPPKRSIRTAGLDPATTDVRVLARRVGFVFQNPEHQFIRHTVAEELAHALELQRLPPDEIAERVAGMLHRFGLAALRNVHPFLLSGGQKRRLSIGTALIAGAPVLALDEPTYGQDREGASELLDVLVQLKEGGTTVLVATHDLQLVADHASHVAVLRGGRLLRSGPTDELLAGDVLEDAGLRHPPLAQAMRALTRHIAYRGISRLEDLP